MSSQSRTSPFVFSNYIDFLQAARQNYGKRKQPIPLQVWAKKLGYKSPRSLELILSGTRIPSDDILFKIVKDLGLNKDEHYFLGLLVKKEKWLKKKKDIQSIEIELQELRPKKYEVNYINNEIFRRVSEWYPMVIRQLAMTPGFKKDLTWIAKKLKFKIISTQIQSAIDEWERLAMGRKPLYTTEDAPIEAGRTFHKKMLRKASEAIDEVNVDHREYISMTFRSSKKNIAEMKKTLRELRDKLNEDFSKDDGNEVFQLCIALFPHTNLED